MDALCKVSVPLGKTAWNRIPLPKELTLGSDLSSPDHAVLVYAGTEVTTKSLDFWALRSSPDPGFSLIPIVSIQRSETGPFRAIHWTRKHALDTSLKFPNGLVTAASDRKILVYNPQVILEGYDSTCKSRPAVKGTTLSAREEYGLVTTFDDADSQDSSTEFAITCLDSDSLSTHNLAAGVSNGIVKLWDLETEQKTISIECGPSSLTSLRWHPQTQNVLVATTAAGSFHVLNPSNRKPLLSITDPNKRNNISGCCWLESGKNVVVVFDDASSQKSPVIQLWDLRHPNYPYREETGTHQQGILGVEVCEVDPRFFVTASREGRCVTWAMSMGNIIPYAEVVVPNPILDFSVSQCGRLPAVATSTANDQISIHLLDSNLCKEVSSLRFAPNWLGNQSGVDFGFAGKITWYTEATPVGSSNVPTEINAPSNRSINVGYICADEEFVALANHLEPYLDSDDFRSFCSAKAHEFSTIDQYEADVWNFIRTAFIPVEQRARHLLCCLGFRSVSGEVEKYLGHPGGSGLITLPPAGSTDSVASSKVFQDPTHFSEITPNPQETESFFNQLANSNEVIETDPSAESLHESPYKEAKTRQESSNNPGYFVGTGSDIWMSTPANMIKNSFLMGDPLSAIEVAVRSSRYTEAFMIAATLNDPQILKSVSKLYSEHHAHDTFITTIARAVDQDYANLIKTCSLANDWQQILAFLITYLYNSTQQFSDLCRFLGKRLEREAGDERAALLVYLAGGLYSESIQVLSSMPATTRLPGARALKLIALSSGCDSLKFNSAAIHIVSLFVDRLVNNGCVNLANRILSLVDGPSQDPGFAVLKYKIAEATDTNTGNFYFPVHEVSAPQPCDSNLGYPQQPNYETTSARPADYYTTGGGFQQQQQQFPPRNASRPQASTYAAPPTLGTMQPPPSSSGTGFGGQRASLQSHTVPYGGLTTPDLSHNTFPSSQLGPPGRHDIPIHRIDQQSIPPGPLNQPLGFMPMGGKSTQPPPVPRPTAISLHPSGQLPPIGGNAPPTGSSQLGGQPPVGNQSSIGHPMPPLGVPPQMAPPLGVPPQMAPPPLGVPPQMAPPPLGVPPQMAPPPLGGTPQMAPPPLSGPPQMAPPPLGGPPQMAPPLGGPPQMAPTPLGGPPQMAPPSGPPPQMPNTNMHPGQGGRVSALGSGYGSDGFVGGLSTHPAASVGNLEKAGLPTPWPIPTEAQQRHLISDKAAIGGQPQAAQGSNARSTGGTSGAVCPSADINKIQQCLMNLVNIHARNGDDSKKVEDNTNRLKDLIKQLESGNVAKPVQQKLLDLCNAVANNDWALATKLQQDLTQIGWNRDSKLWLMALKRLTAGPPRV